MFKNIHTVMVNKICNIYIITQNIIFKITLPIQWPDIIFTLYLNFGDFFNQIFLTNIKMQNLHNV